MGKGLAEILLQTQPLWPSAGTGHIFCGSSEELLVLRKRALLDYEDSAVFFLGIYCLHLLLPAHLCSCPPRHSSPEVTWLRICFHGPSFISRCLWHIDTHFPQEDAYIRTSPGRSESRLWSCRPHSLNAGLACLWDIRSAWRSPLALEVYGLSGCPSCSSLKTKQESGSPKSSKRNGWWWYIEKEQIDRTQTQLWRSESTQQKLAPSMSYLYIFSCF